MTGAEKLRAVRDPGRPFHRVDLPTVEGLEEALAAYPVLLVTQTPRSAERDHYTSCQTQRKCGYAMTR